MVLRPSNVALLVTFVCAIANCAFITTVYSPHFLVPTLITLHATLFAFIRDWTPRIFIIAASCLAWTVSVFGDAWGLLPKTVPFVDGHVLIQSSVVSFPETATTMHLYTAVLATIILPALVVGGFRSAYQRSDMAMRLQSWQPRRLVSDASSATRNAL
jgi:hypothetical protein